MVGMKVIELKGDAYGNVDLADLRAKRLELTRASLEEARHLFDEAVAALVAKPTESKADDEEPEIVLPAWQADAMLAALAL